MHSRIMCVVERRNFALFLCFDVRCYTVSWCTITMIVVQGRFDHVKYSFIALCANGRWRGRAAQKLLNFLEQLHKQRDATTQAE